MAKFLSPSEIRSLLVASLVEVFESQMPIYREMREVVEAVNHRAVENDPTLAEHVKKLGVIMHGAVRVASSTELHTLARVLKVMGLYPYNYYDLRKGVSVNSTAFRAKTRDELLENGFRLFVSMLDLDCIHSDYHEMVNEIIERRNIFHNDLMQLVLTSEMNGGLTLEEAKQFVTESMKIFVRPKKAAISLPTYEKLLSVNGVLGHILVSNAVALNHLTPCVANVHEGHREMVKKGIKTIPAVQGPPEGWSILLNQTSCVAPAVELDFPNNEDEGFTKGFHQETFIEMEERHVALTPKGRGMYDEMLELAINGVTMQKSETGYDAHYYHLLSQAFADFPKDLKLMREKELAFFIYQSTELGLKTPTETLAELTLEELITNKYVVAVPQFYEDFLPKSAEGIFRSNVGEEKMTTVAVQKSDSQRRFEEALGRPVLNMYDYYQKLQFESLAETCNELGLELEAISA